MGLHSHISLVSKSKATKGRGWDAQIDIRKSGTARWHCSLLLGAETVLLFINGIGVS